MRRWCMAAIRIYSPYPHNEGQFQSLCSAEERHFFAFQPDWPALTGLNIDLNFINNGLWMRADKKRRLAT